MSAARPERIVVTGFLGAPFSGRASALWRNRGTSGTTRAPIWRALVVHDRVALIYLAVFAGSLWVIPTAPHALRYQASALFAYVALAIFTARAFVDPPPVLALVYRFALVATVLGSYLLLGAALPILNPDSLDHALYRLDLALFGLEPAILMEALVSPVVTEWFAWFYLSYFVLLAAFILPIAAVSRESRLARELVIGLVAIYTVGQTVYVLVPGYGPGHAMPQMFARRLEGVFMFEHMMALVQSAGAQKDIFPSVHAAVALFLSILAFRHRHGRVLRLAWPVVAFTSANMVVATLYLRWHYLIDVVAGLLLALGAHFAAVRIARHEAGRRHAGLGAAWPALRADRFGQFSLRNHRD